jgi:eukaryotic-like serine/threonine-protein kinase
MAATPRGEARAGRAPADSPSLDGGLQDAAPDTLAASDKPGTEPEIEAVWPTIPGYRILGRLGVGGMGIVYKAEQLGLKRVVAIKTVSAAIQGHSLRRFEAEAAAVARLRHPNIVQIYDIGNCDGLPYFSMEYVPGGSLAERLGGEPQPIRWAARLVADLADAVQAAHDAGVIHRDIKPGNVLLLDQDTAGQPVTPNAAPPGAGDAASINAAPIRKPETLDLRACVPKITDFGVAKVLDQTVGMTISGALIGTPSYMAPEQAEGRTTEIGPAADIHALGVILYRLITGQLPFKGDSVATTLAMVGTHEPVPPYRLNGRIHRDLETICLKCLRKSPAQRYASAGALAADLRSFLAGEPIKARPVSTLERVWTWCVRRPALAFATVVSLAVVFVFLPGWLWYRARLEEAHERQRIADQVAKTAEAARLSALDLARTKEYFSLLDHTRQRNERRPSGWTWAGLEDLRQAAALPTSVRSPRELATEAARCLAGVDLRRAAVWAEKLQQVMIAFSPDGKLLAVADYRDASPGPHKVRVLDGHTGKHLRTFTFEAHVVLKKNFFPVPDGARSVTFDATGETLFVGSRSGYVHRWRLADNADKAVSWKVFQRLPVDWLLVAPGDPDSVIVASSQGDKVARWPIDAEKPAAQAQFKGKVALLKPVPGGEHIAIEAEEKVQFRDARTLALVDRPALPSLWPYAFDSSGAMVVGDREDKLVFVHAPTGAVTRHVGDPNTGMSHRIADLIRFNRDGSLVLSLGYGDDDRLLLLWETASGRVVARMPLPGKDFADAAFHPAKDALVVANDGKVELYEIGGLRVQERIANQALPIVGFDFLPSGELVCAGALAQGDGHSLRATTFCDGAGRLQTERSRFTRHASGSRPGAIVAHPTLPETAALTGGDTVEIWNYAARQARTLNLPTPSHLAFEESGARLWTIDDKRQRATAWAFSKLDKTATWQDQLRILQGTGELYCLATGKSLVVLGSRDGMVHVLRQSDPRSHTELPGMTSPVRSVALDCQERWVAAGFQQGTVKVYDLHSARVVADLADHGDSVESLHFSPDGKLLATGSRDSEVHLYAVRSGAVERLLTFKAWPVQQLRFHPDGRKLGVLLQQEHAVRLWRLDELRERLTEMGVAMSAWPSPPN